MRGLRFFVLYDDSNHHTMVLMARVSKRKIDEKVWEEVWNRWVRVFSFKKDRKEADKLLIGLMTRTERIVLAKRLMTYVLFVSGWEPNKVADLLMMSRSTTYGYRGEYLNKI